MTTLPSMPLDVALIGAGNVGTGVLTLLASRGHRVVGVASRTRASARRSAELLGADVFELDAPVQADLYLIGTGPAAIASVSQDLAHGIDLTGRVLVHLSGAHGIALLESARVRGAHTLALHPVQACPSIEAAVRNLPGSTWGVTASEGAEGWAEDLVRSLEGVPVRVREEDRMVWHSAAVVTSNGIAALLAAGERILRGIGVQDPEAVLAALASGTLANARTGGGGARTLTGPVVRGELEVIRSHVDALSSTDAELASLYRTVAQLIADVAASSGRLEDGVLVELRAILERST